LASPTAFGALADEPTALWARLATETGLLVIGAAPEQDLEAMRAKAAELQAVSSGRPGMAEADGSDAE